MASAEGKKRAAPAAAAGRSPSKRRTHNLAEQRRAQRIRSQIDELKEIMEGDGMSVPSTQFAVLKSAVEYIHQLKSKVDDSNDSDESTQLQQALVEYAGQRVAPPPPLPLPGSTPPYAPPGSSLRGPAGVDYRQVFAYGGVACAVSTLDGHFVDANRLFSFYTGFAREEILRRTIFSMMPPQELENTFRIVSEIMSSPQPITKHFTKQCLFKRGPNIVYASMSVIRDPSNKPTHFACSFVPIAPDAFSTESCVDESGSYTVALGSDTNQASAGAGVDASAACLTPFADAGIMSMLGMDQATACGAAGAGRCSAAAVALPAPATAGAPAVPRLPDLAAAFESGEALPRATVAAKLPPLEAPIAMASPLVGGMALGDLPDLSLDMSDLFNGTTFT